MLNRSRADGMAIGGSVLSIALLLASPWVPWSPVMGTGVPGCQRGDHGSRCGRRPGRRPLIDSPRRAGRCRAGRSMGRICLESKWSAPPSAGGDDWSDVRGVSRSFYPGGASAAVTYGGSCRRRTHRACRRNARRHRHAAGTNARHLSDGAGARGRCRRHRFPDLPVRAASSRLAFPGCRTSCAHWLCHAWCLEHHAKRPTGAPTLWVRR